jgi:uncharacterized protein HemY
VAAGVGVLNWGVGGLYWLVAGVILSLLVVVAETWILLVVANHPEEPEPFRERHKS